jgi:RNA polymerase sigma factor (TIGR02999 family)
MDGLPERDITALLRDWSGGDREALERLVPIVYAELRRLAAAQLRAERPDHTLQPTALVHETYLRLAEQRSVAWANRSHFFRIAARIMRRILVDHARRRRALKRGSDPLRLVISDAEPVDPVDRAPELVALDAALDSLERVDPQQARIVELRFFGGLTVEETADAAGVSTATVKREWRTARAWLRREMDLSP